MQAIGMCAALLLGSQTALASNNYEDIKQAISTGEASRALELVEQAQKQNPKDVQLMFFEGVIKAQTGNTRGAIALFEDMAAKYPELPEPHNNLGVLYAAAGDLEKAKTAFERAILTNPAYATAHKNIADVYAALAKQNYGKALQVDAANAPQTPQMTLLGNLAPGAKPQDNVVVAELKPETRPPAPTEPVATQQAQPQAAPAVTPAAKPTAPNKASMEKAIENSVLAWAKAWSKRDTSAYLSAYSNAFDPGRGLSLSAWKQQRKDRIQPRKSINVTISKLRISITGKTAVVDFFQDYSSDSFSGTSNKRLNMVLEGDRWLIVKESVR